MSNAERRLKNEEVKIRRTYESRITTNKVSLARRGGLGLFPPYFACPPRRVFFVLSALYIVLGTSYMVHPFAFRKNILNSTRVGVFDREECPLILEDSAPAKAA
jgi:hypothetical protein